MEKQHALQQLEQLQKKLYAIHYACSAMNLDADTVAPKNTSEGRGVALGVLATWAVERATGWSAVMEPWSVLLAVGFAGLVGVFFGYYPARRAARLQPIVALRHE